MAADSSLTAISVSASDRTGSFVKVEAASLELTVDGRHVPVQRAEAVPTRRVVVLVDTRSGTTSSNVFDAPAWAGVRAILTLLVQRMPAETQVVLLTSDPELHVLAAGQELVQKAIPSLSPVDPRLKAEKRMGILDVLGRVIESMREPQRGDCVLLITGTEEYVEPGAIRRLGALLASRGLVIATGILPQVRLQAQPEFSAREQLPRLSALTGGESFEIESRSSGKHSLKTLRAISGILNRTVVSFDASGISGTKSIKLKAVGAAYKDVDLTYPSELPFPTGR